MFVLPIIMLIMGAAVSLSVNDPTPLLSDFEAQIQAAVHGKVASHYLTYFVAKQVLHLDASLYGNDPTYEATFDKITKHTRHSNEEKAGYILCGSQRNAKFARSEISRIHSGRLSMAYASRRADIACWQVFIGRDEANRVAYSSAFFHVSQIPALAKLAPGLLSMGWNDQITPTYQVMKTGVRIQLQSNVDHNKLLSHCDQTRFGFLLNEHSELLYPISDPSVESWQSVRSVLENGDCVEFLNPLVKDLVFSSSRYLHLSFEKLTTNLQAEACAVVVLAYLATQNEVMNIEVMPTFELRTLIPKPRNFKNSLHSYVMDEDNEDVGFGGTKPMNTISTAALQSGNESEPNPFWDLGINGTGQYVEVSDTGFDDASCFLRQENSAGFLTGELNTDYQVARSGYSSPTTDHTRRKVVQYLMRDTSDSEYAQDYASGHGSHVAGTIAGYIPNDGSTQGTAEDYYNNCEDYDTYCDTWFAEGGSDEGLCDTTCNISATGDNSGMAPGAKLMVYDFGDDSGSLDVPTNMKTLVFKPAYDEGARILSNSWGAGAPYNYYDNQAINIDDYIYDEDDVLILFAAGNEGGDYGDDTYDNGDATIGAPAICKNVLTVGAAETSYTPDTVAYFSSRGPSKDMRLKPEVCGPGNPVKSASASGSAGLASCAVTPMSGTSMATPAVAGTAALIREILVEGRHQEFSSTGYGGSTYSESAPSGALLKALLIGSTVPLTYGYDSSGDTVTLADFYSASSAVADSTAYALGTTGVDFTQGFGHVRLSNIFSLDGSFDTFCYEDSLAEYSTWTSEFTVSSTALGIAVTLVWTDPPGSRYCGYDYEQGSTTDTCLIHDLDLKVYNDGTRLYSNFGAGDGDYSGQEDTYNNAEKTSIAASDLTVGTSITVTVETNGLSYADTQKFAVVVTGNLAFITPAPTLPPSPAPTLVPTTIDTVTVITSFDMFSSAVPTDDDKTSLKSTIAIGLNVSDTSIKGFSVTYTSSRRVRRHLLTTYTWTAAFEVTVSLASTSSSTSADLATSISSTVSSTSFASTVATHTGAIVDDSSVKAFVATNSPTQVPTPTPSSLPTMQPSSKPSPTPTEVPSSQPNPAPTPIRITFAPSALPTASDMVIVATSFDLTSDAIPTENDKTSLKSTIATGLDVSETSIKGFSVTYTSSRRVRRHLLTTYTWTAAFEVTVSLASTSSSTSADLASSISSTLISTSFTSTVSTNTGATVDTDSMSAIVVTLSPTSAPVMPPSMKSNSNKSDHNSILIDVLLVLMFVVLAMLCCVFFTSRKKESVQVVPVGPAPIQEHDLHYTIGDINL